MTNPLIETLKARIPGESFRLPSQALFYTNGELDESVKEGEVHVYPMTGIDEIVLRTPDKLLSGEGIAEVFQHCIPQILKPRDLLAKDVDYLLMALRLLSYGNDLSVSYQHGCENSKSHSYTIPIRPLLRESRQIDPTTLAQVFVLTTSAGQVVHLRPALFKNVIEVFQTSVLASGQDEFADKDLKKIHTDLVEIFVNMILEVDGISDRDQIREWVTLLTPGMLQEIGTKSQEIANWGLNPVVSIECRDCRQSIPLEVPVNPVSFFI